MGLSEVEEIHEKHQQLCADLNMDKETARASWASYLQTKHNYTLEGDQRHWLACAIYVACRKTSVPAVGRTNTYIEGNLVSLTRLLRLCELTLLQFIDKCRKWANMVHLTTDFKGKISLLERKLSVSTVVFKKFQEIFDIIFQSQDADASTEQDRVKAYKKKGLSNTKSLKEFLWTLYLVVKSDFSDIGDDLVSSYHLLLACCDLVYANAVCSDRRDILNRKFVGIPQHFFDDDYDPPTEPICIIDELCKIHQGISIDAKSVREYSFKNQIKKLFERETLRGDASHFLEILNTDFFDANFRAVNKTYEQYVLSVGDFDERVMLTESVAEYSDFSQSSSAHKDNMTDSESKEDVDRPSIIHPNTLTPLTGRQYLKNRDGASIGVVTPMLAAQNNIIRLHSMLQTPRTHFGETLKETELEESAILDIENEIKSKLSRMMSLCQPPEESVVQPSEPPVMYFSQRRMQVAEKLFYKMLDDIAASEVRMGKPDVGESVRQDLFLRSLFACAVEIVFFSYGWSQLKFPWVLDTLELPAYHFYKIIELVVRTETQLSRDMVKHLNMLEEKILDSLSWTSDSPLWKTIEASNMPVPTCEDVCLPYQLSSLDGRVEHMETLNAYTSRSTNNDDNGRQRPRRGGSLGLFFRKFYHLASVRMQDLCSQLGIGEAQVRYKIWTCLEHVVVQNVHLMKNRHLDQILMCTVYVACKVLEINLTFQEIMKCYRNQPQSASHVYRNVLLAQVGSENQENAAEERGDLIKFYNSVFVKSIQNFALKFSSKSNNRSEPLILSPLPVSKSKTNSPFRRVSDKFPIFIRSLVGADNVAPSPTKPLSYYFSRSPAKDLHAINNSMVSYNSVKRSLKSMEEEGTPIKKFHSVKDKTKLQDLIEDRRKFQT